MRDSSGRSCLGCSLTLVAMGVFGLLYAWPHQSGPTGLLLQIIRIGLLCAGALGTAALIASVALLARRNR